MALTDCDTCESGPPAIYVDIELMIDNDTSESDALYCCEACVMRVRGLIGKCARSRTKPDERIPSGFARVVFAEVDGADLEEWQLCNGCADRISKMKRPVSYG